MTNGRGSRSQDEPDSLWVLLVALALFVPSLTLALTVSVKDGGGLLLVVPVAFVAYARGQVAGLGAAGLAFALFAVAASDDDAGLLAYVRAGAIFLLLGGLVGYLADHRRDGAQAQHDLLDTLPDGAVEVAEGRIVWANRRAAEMFGYEDDELVGAPADLLIPAHLCGDDPRAASGPEGGHLRGPDNNEFIARRKDGTPFPAEITLARRRDDGQPRITVVIRDTTERTRALETRARVEALFEYSEEAIIATSPDGIILRWNPGAARMLGYTADEVVGRKVESLVPDDCQGELDDLIHRVGAGEVVRGLETRRCAKDGSVVDVALTASGIRDRDGELVAFSATYKDITARKKAERALAEAEAELVRRAERLERSNEQLRTFARTVAHDLSSPLAAISLLGQAVQADYEARLDDRGRKLLGRIVEGSLQMHDMIDKLLDFSQEVPERPDPVEVDMGEVVQTALASLAPEDLNGDAPVAVEPLPRVHGDADQLVRLFQNLIGNAFKYRHSERPLRVRVCGERLASGWCFKVADTGMGIDPRHAEHIFDAFHRAPEGQHVSGSGLGLAIAKHIVEWHGGEIWVESQPGSGATFSFTIPDAYDVEAHAEVETASA